MAHSAKVAESSLLSVAEAQGLVLKHAEPLPAENALLNSAALGLVLAEDIASDLDMPPYDKAMMDGYAVRSTDLIGGSARLAVIEEVTAGMVPKLAVGPGQATCIMTGAPMPSGADAVVPVERTQLSGDTVQIDGGTEQMKGGAEQMKGGADISVCPGADRNVRSTMPIKPGQNVSLLGQEMRRGDIVLKSGARLRPQEFGILATVGRTAVKAHPAPRVAVLSTGDEIVESDQTPGPGQIRNGNGPMLMAQVSRAGALPRYLGNARDTRESLRALITEGLQAHVLVLTGGVSAGKLDLVPGVLQELGVQAQFHKVAMKPGKPIFFGTRAVASCQLSVASKQTIDPAKGAAASSLATDNWQLATLVFGLPGNPVSSYVCFELFVRPALRRLRNLPDPRPRFVQAKLAVDFAHRSDRPTYHPAWLEDQAGGWSARPVPWFGSPDLRGLASANSFLLFAAGEHQYRAGQECSVLCVEGQD